MILPTSSWVVKSKIGLVYILGKPIFAQFFRACLLSQTHLKYFIYQYGWIDQNMDQPRPIFRTSTFLLNNFTEKLDLSGIRALELEAGTLTNCVTSIENLYGYIIHPFHSDWNYYHSITSSQHSKARDIHGIGLNECLSTEISHAYHSAYILRSSGLHYLPVLSIQVLPLFKHSDFGCE